MPPLPPMEDNFDLCEIFQIADFPLFKKFTDLMNLPKNCPVEPVISTTYEYIYLYHLK